MFEITILLSKLLTLNKFEDIFVSLELKWIIKNLFNNLWLMFAVNS